MPGPSMRHARAPRQISSLTRLVAAAVLAVLLVGSVEVYAAPDAATSHVEAVHAASPPVSATWLSGPSQGANLSTADSVTWRAKVTSARPLKARFTLISVRDAQGRSFDMGRRDNVRIDAAGTTLAATRTLPAGTYKYRVGYRTSAGDWVNVGDVRTFTVSKSQVSQQPPRSSAQRWSMGYFVGYLHRRYPLESVNWDSLTHMAVGAALPRSDGSLDTTFFQDATAGPAWAKRVVAAAHEHDRKAILMLGGAGYKSGFSGAISGANRARFITNLLRVVDEYGFDGVDVDLEPLVETDGPNLMAFSRELRAARPSLLMTIPISAVNDNRPVQTQLSYLRELPRHYDQLNVMSYGLTSTWRGWRSWHTTPLSGAKPTTPMSVASSVEAYLRAGIPAAKLGMGVGFYGACYRGVTGPNQTSPSMTIVADDNKMSIANVMRDYYQSSLVTWDNEAQAPYLSSPTPIGPLGCTFIPFENERSLALKMRYAQSKGLGGIIIWNVNEGYLSPATGQDALLGVIERSRFMP